MKNNKFSELKSFAIGTFFVMFISLLIVGALYIYKSTHQSAPPNDVVGESGLTKEPETISIPSEPIANQISVTFKAGTTEEAKQEYIKSIGGTIVSEIPNLDTFVINVSEEIAAKPLPESEKVAVSEPDYQLGALADISNDARVTEQWALETMNIQKGWDDVKNVSQSTLVAVIDSGICTQHEDLKDKFVGGKNFINNSTNVEDDFGHGCSVSGIIASTANNTLGIAGVAPNVKILPLKVLDNQGLGSYSNVAAAIVYAADNGAKIINLSLGGPNASTLLENAVNYAKSKNVIVVAASGNTGKEGVLYPAAYDYVIAVGSVDKTLERSSFSTFGPQLDIYAPGRDILTTKKDGSYGLVSGTSFAAPQVAGMEAISLALKKDLILDGKILSLDKNKDVVIVAHATSMPTPTPSSTPNENIVQYSGTPINSGDGGYPFPNDSSNETDPWGFAKRNCTSYVAWRLNIDRGISALVSQNQYEYFFYNGMLGGHWGNAYEWFGNNTSNKIFEVVTTPRAGDIALWNATAGTYHYTGHVAYISVVNSDGSLVFSDYNYNGQETFRYGGLVAGENSPDHYLRISPQKTDDKIILYDQSNQDTSNFSSKFYIIKPNTTAPKLTQLPDWIDNKVSSIWIGNNFCAYSFDLPVDDLAGTGITRNSNGEVITNESNWTNTLWTWFPKGTSIGNFGNRQWNFNTVRVDDTISSILTGQPCQLNGAGLSAAATCINGNGIASQTPDNTTACNGRHDGLYCGQTLSLNPSILYRCRSGLTSSAQTCNSGCSVQAQNTDDFCLAPPSAKSCPNNKNGTYCGDSLALNTNKLYDCQYGVSTEITSCQFGCAIKPAGTADVCKGAASTGTGVCPAGGDGDYCGSTLGLDENKLYTCTAGKIQEKATCGLGCKRNPSLTPDVCYASGEGGSVNNSGTVKFFGDSNMTGNVRLSLPAQNSDEPSRSTIYKSIEIPSGWSIVLHDKPLNEVGNTQCFNQSIPLLESQGGWSTSIESVEVHNTNVCPSPNTDSWVKICKNTGISDCTVVTTDIPDLAGAGFGDNNLKSIDFAGNWEAVLFEHGGYGGRSVTLSDDNNDLGGLSFGYGASSISVRKKDPAIFTLYSLGNYNGTPFQSDRSIENLDHWQDRNQSGVSWNDHANSIRVSSGYEVIVCSDASSRGTCARFTSDQSDLGSVQNQGSSVFICQGSCPPGASNPTLVSPMIDETFLPNTPLLFNWVGDGEQYDIEIWGGNLTNPIKDFNRNGVNILSKSGFEGSVNPYSWHVRGYKPYGPSNWSPTFTFKVQDIAPSYTYISGPSTAIIAQDNVFTAFVSPSNTANLTYTWSPSPKSGQGTSAVTYNWTTPNMQNISVSVTNTGGTLNTSMNINVGCEDGKYLTEYYGNKTLSGIPLAYSCEDTINNDWQDGGPTQVPSNSFNVGTGIDGALDVPAGQTVYTDNVRTKISTVTSVGQAVVCVATTSGFAVGDEVLLVQSRGTNIGNYETKIISSIGGCGFTMQNNLTNAYDSTYAQVLRIPQYTTVNVAGTLTVHPWDGVTGGVMVFKATSGVNLNGGTIDVSGKGLRGGARTFGRAMTGLEGEGYTTYTPQNSTAPNSGGGGGGGGSNDGGAAAGGGSYASNGGRGYDPSYGDPGSAAETFFTDPLLPRIHFGGAGGAGGTDDSGWDNSGFGGKGGNGGGIIIIETNEIKGNGQVKANGEKGEDHNAVSTSSEHGGGGGGAGGSIKLLADKFNTDNILIDYSGNAGGKAKQGDGGSGGVGIGYFTYCSKLGSNPTSAWTLAANCNKDNFSVRWNGNINFPNSNTYSFATQADDGIRLFLDGSTTPLINRWADGFGSDQANQVFTAGNHAVKVEYYDSTNTAIAKLNITQQAGVTPTLNQIPGQTINNGQTFQTIDLNSYVTNLAQQTSLTWSATGNTNISVAIANNIATLTYPGSWTGTENIAFKATNQDAQYATSTAAFVVNTTQTSVELLSSPWNLSGNNGSSEKYQSISTSVLAGKTTMRITYDLHGINALGGDASAIIFDQNGWQYISLSNYGINGKNGPQTIDIPLSAFTGLNLATGSNTVHTRFWYGSAFTVDITSIKLLGPGGTNNPPTITTSALLTGSENVAYAYDVNATDPENNTLTYSLAQNPTGMTINSSTGVISWTPSYTQSGTTHIKIGVSDGTNTVYQEYDLVIANVNRAPTFTQVPGQTITNGQTFTTINLPTYGTDPDSDAITWSYTGNTNITVAIASGIATLTYPGTWTGTNNIVFKATDPSNAFATSTAAFVVNPVSTCPYTAQYYNNKTLTGSPVLTRCENEISYNWYDGRPAPGVNTDNFSVRWTGNFTFAAGTYNFVTDSDDGIRLWIDNVQKINDWNVHGSKFNQVSQAITAGTHSIKIEYFDGVGGARASFSWLLPQTQTSNCIVQNKFCAKYFNNTNLSGTPVLSVLESDVDHDWGSTAPGGGVNADNYSVRWEGSFEFGAGTYDFGTASDDGVRLWVDGVLVIDNWVAHGYEEDYAIVNMTAGFHTIKMEFYEGGGNALAAIWW